MTGCENNNRFAMFHKHKRVRKLAQACPAELVRSVGSLNQRKAQRAFRNPSDRASDLFNESGRNGSRFMCIPIPRALYFVQCLCQEGTRLLSFGQDGTQAIQGVRSGNQICCPVDYGLRTSVEFRNKLFVVKMRMGIRRFEAIQ